MKFSRFALVLPLLCLISIEAFASDRVTVIKAGSVITGTGETISPGEVVIEDGKITLVGSQLEIPDNARIIDARNQTLMPGLVLAQTSQGLLGGRVSGVGCDQTVLTRWVESEMDWEAFLEAGVVAAAFVPAGTGFHGQAIVVHTGPEGGGSNPSRVRLLALGGDRFNILASDGPTGFRWGRGVEIEKVKKAREKWDKEQEEAKKKAKEEKESEEDAAADSKEKEKEEPKEFKAPEIRPSLKPLVAILEEKSTAMPMVVSISSPGAMLHVDAALESVKELEDRDPQAIFVLPGSRNGAFHVVIDQLIERKATVLIPPGMSALPDTYFRYHVPAALSRGGCDVITLPRSDNPGGMRELPGFLAEQVRYGMSAEDAIASLTSKPAKFLGLGDRMGTIEEGKDAHLIVLNGSLLDPGAHVMKTIISGKVVWDREDR